jgi:hypothetical protein
MDAIRSVSFGHNRTPPPAIVELNPEVKLSLLRGRRGPQACETSSLSRFLDNRLTGGGEVVSLTRRPPPQIPGTHFY